VTVNEIVKLSTLLMNQARSARNEGDEELCQSKLRDLFIYLGDNLPEEMAENPAEPKEVTP
jgi:hypothetical protein